MKIAQEYLNTWGCKTFGKSGEYTIEMEHGYQYYSTLTGGDSWMNAKVLRDGKEVKSISEWNFSFTELLNEIIEANLP